MKLTESYLRKIIKQELNSVLNEVFLGPVTSPMGQTGGTRTRKDTRSDAKKAAATASISRAKNTDQDYEETLARSALVILAKKLLEKDKDYVSRFLTVYDESGKRAYVNFEPWVGQEFRNEFQNLANESLKIANVNQDPLPKFKQLAMKFAPVRAGEGVGSKIARGLGNVFYNPKTKE